MFNSLEEIKTFTVREVLTKLAECTTITETDEQLARYYANRLGIPIQVVCGIVYIQGEAPIGVNQFFQMILKILEKKVKK